jgi:hypothetical protein
VEEDVTQKQFDELRKLQKEVADVGHSLSDLMRDLGPSVTPTIESVYRKPLDKLKPPKGHRFTGEFILPIGSMLWADPVSLGVSTFEDSLPNDPRLILVKCKRLVFDVVDENRKATWGEWFMGGMKQHICRADSTGTLDIVPYILSEPRVEE